VRYTDEFGNYIGPDIASSDSDDSDDAQDEGPAGNIADDVQDEAPAAASMEEVEDAGTAIVLHEVKSPHPQFPPTTTPQHRPLVARCASPAVVCLPHARAMPSARVAVPAPSAARSPPTAHPVP